MDKIRAHREELKRLWFNLPVSQKKVKTITVKIGKNKFWPGYGYVQILSDGPDGYSSFSTHQEHPLQYAKDRMSQDKYKEYKLIVK